MNRTKEEFVNWSNQILKDAGIGTHDNGQKWYEYCLEDGIITACDYSECLVVDNWKSVTREDIVSEAEAYLDDVRD